jgi:hypothetical protein
MKFSLCFIILIIAAISLQAAVIREHNIQLSVQPAQHFLKATDRITYKETLQMTDTLYLPQNLKVNSVLAKGVRIRFTTQMDSAGYQLLKLTPLKPVAEITIAYEGFIYFALQGRNLNQGHDFSQGMISDKADEGIFLPENSWYPVHATDELMHFDVTARSPLDMVLITSGTETHTIDDSQNVYHWQTEQLTNGLTLCGNRFHVAQKMLGQTRLAVYLLPADAALAEQYLNAMESIYNRYTSLLGNYPFSSFSLVENFFASGFGMPNYTLLAKEIVRMPNITLSPGSLAHEFVHNWWGNSVFVKPGSGNWCEALTTFCSNYYWYELEHDKASAVKYRKNAIYSINQLPSERTYPLEQFLYQRNDDDAVIGYQRGSMFFYTLYRYLGETAFFNTLRQIAAEEKASYLSWDDLALRMAAQIPADKEADLQRLFRETLTTTALPEIRLSATVINKPATIFELEQSDPPHLLQIPVRIETDTDKSEMSCLLTGKTMSVTLQNQSPLESIVVDPDYEVLRFLPEDEMPLNLTRNFARKPLLILPENSTAQSRLDMLVMMLGHSGFDFDVVRADSVQNNILADRDLILFGSVQENSITKRLAKALPDGFTLRDTLLIVNNQTYAGKQSSLLLTCQNPFNREKMLTVYTWNDESAVPSFRKMFHYMEQSWQVFDLEKEANAPVASGDIYRAHTNLLTWQKQ